MCLAHTSGRCNNEKHPDKCRDAETQRKKVDKIPLNPPFTKGEIFLFHSLAKRGQGRFDSFDYCNPLYLCLRRRWGGGGGSSPTGPGTTVAFSGSSSGYNVYMARNSSLSSGSVLAVDIKVDSVSNVFGAAFDIDFDSTKMTYSSYSAGSFLETGGNSVSYQPVTQSGNSGKLIVGVSRQAPSGGQSGSGILVTLKFNVTGGTSVSFSNNALKDSSNNTVSATWSSGGTVTVQ